MGSAHPLSVDAIEPAPAELSLAQDPAAGTSDKTRTVERLTAETATTPLPGSPAMGDNVRRLLVKALKAYKRQDYAAAALRALEATRLDGQCSQAYHTLAIALEGLGELHKALQMYERALALDPEDPEIYLNLGLAAWKLRMFEGAEKFFRLYISMQPLEHTGYNNLGGVLRDQRRFDESVECLRNAIYQFPNNAELWNTLGTVAMEQGTVREARLFYEEAVRLAPRMPRIYHNIAYAISHTGPLEDTLAYYDKALKLMGTHADSVEARHGRAQALLGLGRLKEGWQEWEIRHDRRFRGSFIYAINAPRWEGEDLTGKRLLVMGEQGLGDEILFATGYHELIEQLGPEGKLVIAADYRMRPLLERSFPKAEVREYLTKSHNAKGVRLCPWLNAETAVDYFTTNGSTLRFLRNDIARFDTDRPILVPDPVRVAHWKAQLEALGPGPYVGICWRSMVTAGTRGKYFSPLDAWAPVLQRQDVRFINLQYGDCADELAHFRDRLGVHIHDFPGIDLKNDLDEAAALSAAVDLAIAAPTAAGAIAASCGTETWFPTIGYSWTMLGTDHYPWYPRNRAFWPREYGDWAVVMASIAAALGDFAARHAP